MDSRAHKFRYTHSFHPLTQKRELNTPSGSLVERATGLAPHRLICEYLPHKQLCASVLTLCWSIGGGGAALPPICTLINLQKHLLNPGKIDSIYMWNSQGHLVFLARATPRASVVLQILSCTQGQDNDILCPITPAANTTGHDGKEHTINPVSIIDTTSIPQIRTPLKWRWRWLLENERELVSETSHTFCY